MFNTYTEGIWQDVRAEGPRRPGGQPPPRICPRTTRDTYPPKTTEGDQEPE